MSDKAVVASVFLNRECPRRCPYCGSRRFGMKRLTGEQWLDAIDILREQGIEFFLFLGNEPLMLGEELVVLVKGLAERNIEYGLYSTSPQPLFSQWREKLLDAGLKNWSAGVDFIPEVYERMKKEGRLSEKAIRLIESQGQEIVRKAEESLEGLVWMYEKGVEEILSLITVSRANVEMLYDMVVWLADNVVKDGRWKVSYNYVEWNHGDKDFMVGKEEGEEWWLSEEDRELWQGALEKLEEQWEQYPFIQPVKGYLTDIDKALKQDVKWWKEYGFTVENLSVECDGKIRACGYREGEVGYSVWDFVDKADEVWEAWRREVMKCKGCYWAWPHMLANAGVQVCDFGTEYWKRKYGRR
jgi:MoaA/NifB/PqqE/SkfB family radical SAM enzyme